MNIVFNQGQKSFINVGKRQEEVLTYVSADKKSGLQFHADPRRAWNYVILRSQNMTPAQREAVITAYVVAGVNQHNFKGGYDEAVSKLTLKVD